MKLVILCFILVIVHVCSAQSYIPFPDSNARWSECSYVYGGWPGGSSNNYNGSLYALGNDTVIDGYEYTLVGYQHTYFYQVIQPGTFITFDNSPINPPGAIFGAIREDTNKKVWFRKLFDNPQVYCDLTQNRPFNTDVLLYDFDLHIGDVVAWKYGQKTVVSIDSVQFDDGIFRKRYYFGGFSGIFKEYWIEGMGSTLGLFGAYGGLPGEGSCTLHCFWKDGEYIFSYLLPSWSSCDQYVGIDNIASINGPKVFPTLFSDKLNIAFDNGEHCTIQLKDITGKTLISEDSYSQNSILDVSSLKPGIYFIVIKNSEKQVLLQKVVKI